MATEKFHHKTPGGEIVLPKFKHLPARLARIHRNLDAGDQVLTFIEEVAPDQLDELDKLTFEQLAELATAWQKDSQVTTGESSAS